MATAALLPARRQNGYFEELATVRTRRSHALTSTRPVPGPCTCSPLPLPQRFPGGGTLHAPGAPFLAQAPPVHGDRGDEADMGASRAETFPHRHASGSFRRRSGERGAAGADFRQLVTCFAAGRTDVGTANGRVNGSPDPRDYIMVSRLRRSGSSDALPTRGIPAVSATAAASLRPPPDVPGIRVIRRSCRDSPRLDGGSRRRHVQAPRSALMSCATLSGWIML